MSKEEYPRCPLCDKPMIPIVRDESPIEDYRCEVHGEFNPVTVLLPKKLIEFIRNMEDQVGTISQYLGYSTIQHVGADLGTDDIFVPTTKDLIKKYDLADLLMDTIVGDECKEVLKNDC